VNCGDARHGGRHGTLNRQRERFTDEESSEEPRFALRRGTLQGRKNPAKEANGNQDSTEISGS